MGGLCGLCGGTSASGDKAVESAPETTYKSAPSPRADLPHAPHRLMLLVDEKARDSDLNKAIRRLRMQGQHELLVHELRKDSDAEKFVRAAFDAAAMSPVEKTIHVFVACGGDATVNAVAGALVACAAPKSCCMAVVPRGLGPHDFATFLNLPLNATEALDIAANADCEPIDIGLLNKSQVFLNMVVAGFAAELDPNDDSAATPEAYYPSLATIIRPSGDTVTAEKCPDDRQTVEVNGALALLAVGNGAHFAGASLDDGLLEVLYAMDLSNEQAGLLAQGLATGSNSANLQQDMHSMHVPWLEVHAPGGLQLRVDGQVLFEEDVRFDVLHRRLRLAMPRGPSQSRLSRKDLIQQARMTRHARSISDSSRGSGGRP